MGHYGVFFLMIVISASLKSLVILYPLFDDFLTILGTK